MDAARWQKRGTSKQSNARGGDEAAADSARRKGMMKGVGIGGGGGKKKQRAIKLVYIGNPVRVTTSEAAFRALVQELTGRHADLSKYSEYSGGGAGALDDADADDSSGVSQQSQSQSQAEPQGAVPSPVSTEEGSSDAAAAAAAATTSHVPAPDGSYGGNDDDSFALQLIDNNYTVFSPPTFLYGLHNEW